MPLSTVAVAPGESIDRLAGLIGDLKATDPLQPVVVAVPTNTCGVMTRRALGRRAGLVGVDMVTLNRLAELIAGPSLAERRVPMSTPVIDLAISSVLRRDPGTYRPVADHPSTVVALREVHRELRLAGPAAAELLARRSRRGREAVRVSHAVAELLADSWYDEADLFTGAAGQATGGAPKGLHHLVVHLPDELIGTVATFVRALAQHVGVHLLVERSGHADADTEIDGLLATFGATPPSAHPAARCPPERVVSTTDADDEVLVAVRTIVDAARRGVPFERMAVLWPEHRPYARLVEHHLGVAGIPWNGRPGTELPERLLPRLVLDLLDVDRRGLRRRELFALLADVPARDANGRPLPTAAWERASREAGVVRDHDWEPRLRSLARREQWAEAATGLADHVADLRRTLGPPGRRRSWRSWADWCDEQATRWIGRSAMSRLDDPEYRAWEALCRALDRLRHLDSIGAPVTRHEFRTALLAELDDAPAREGRVGEGVTVGSLAGAVGFDVDVAIVLGGAEGTLPPRPTTHPLLGDADRVAVGLPGADVRRRRLHRRLLSVLATATTTITYPRGDLRATTRNEPSRWIAPWMTPPRLVEVDSHRAGLAASAFPSSSAEHRLRAGLAHVGAGRPWTSTDTDDPVLARALAMQAGRATERLTVYDGDLSAADPPILDGTVSPSQLEAWVACPHGYFVHYLLGVRPVEEPGAEISITARDRGSAHHEVLDRFHRAVLDGELPQPGAEGWGELHRRSLLDIFDDVCDTTERRGRGGRPASWADERARMRDDLLGWLDHDAELVRRRGTQVVASELRFDQADDVTVLLAGGRRLRFRGSIDRVDRTADGRLIVTDHKTGNDRDYGGLSEADPTLGATLLQLPAYAAAAQRLLGDDRTVVHAEYAFLGRANYRRHGYTFTPDVWDRVAADLTAVVDGIESGWFPARPERPGWRMFVPCEYCEPDHLGTAPRWAEWDRKRHDPRLLRWFGDGDD